MIQVEHLTKCYGTFTAVDDLSFEIGEGHVYGFLGPNGAGKSTTMNIIAGCLSATDGRVLIDGHDIFEDPLQAKKQIGYLPEHPPLYMLSLIHISIAPAIHSPFHAVQYIFRHCPEGYPVPVSDDSLPHEP